MANENNIIKAVVENAQVDIPDCMVETELTYELDDFAQRLGSSGIKLEDYFKYMGTSVEDYKKDHKDEALATVKTRLVVEALIKELKAADKISVTEEEIDARIEEVTKGTKVTPEQLKESGQTSYIENDLLMQKVLKFLTENNTFTKAKAKKEEKKEDKAEKSQETAEQKREDSEAKPASAEKPKAKRTKKTQE